MYQHKLLKFAYIFINHSLLLLHIYIYGKKHNDRYSLRHDWLDFTKDKDKFAQSDLRFQLPTVINALSNCISNKVNTHSFYGYSQYVKQYMSNQYTMLVMSAIKLRIESYSYLYYNCYHAFIIISLIIIMYILLTCCFQVYGYV